MAKVYAHVTYNVRKGSGRENIIVLSSRDKINAWTSLINLAYEHTSFNRVGTLMRRQIMEFNVKHLTLKTIRDIVQSVNIAIEGKHRQPTTKLVVIDTTTVSGGTSIITNASLGTPMHIFKDSDIVTIPNVKVPLIMDIDLGYGNKSTPREVFNLERIIQRKGASAPEYINKLSVTMLRRLLPTNIGAHYAKRAELIEVVIQQIAKRNIISNEPVVECLSRLNSMNDILLNLTNMSTYINRYRASENRDRQLTMPHLAKLTQIQCTLIGSNHYINNAIVLELIRTPDIHGNYRQPGEIMTYCSYIKDIFKDSGALDNSELHDYHKRVVDFQVRGKVSPDVNNIDVLNNHIKTVYDKMVKMNRDLSRLVTPDSQAYEITHTTSIILTLVREYLALFK